MAQLNDLLVLGKTSLIGEISLSSKITQGNPSSDSTIINMNRFETDLFVQGSGVAPNTPKVAGFYLGKSQSDENRHMDIVSGGDYSYIDFNKASSANDYTTRLITNVSTGLTEYNWASGATNKKFQINGALGVSSGLTVTGNASITNLLTVGSAATHYGIKVGDVYINAISGNLIFQNLGALRFGADSWDYNVWAGLKYDSSNKIIYLGLADNSIFTANSAQSGGTLSLPGVRYFVVNGKRVLDANDTWLRINENSAFSAGTYFGTSIVRTDNQLQVGSGGANFYANSAGKGFFKNTLRIGTSASMTLDGNWCEGIRINAPDGQWVTIALGTTENTGTNANCWSIHRTNTGAFAISRNSSDGSNGLVMTSTGMGLGTTAPEQRFHVVGKSKFTDRIYANEWIQFAGSTGLYFPGDGCNGLHVMPNTVGSFAPVRIVGSRGGYGGVHCGDNNTGFTLMSGEPHQGLYNESVGRWVIYLHRTNNTISIGNSNSRSGYINMGGSTYVEGNLHLNNSGHAGIGLYNTSSINSYGIHMSQTSSYGTYGQVSGDWATYFAFDGAVNRGWIFKNAGTNVFSVNGNGTLSVRENVPGIFFRPGHASYDAVMTYETSGNEAMLFTTKNAVTSFMFVNGEDIVTNNASDRWTKVTPGLQIKNNCVAIGKLIANGSTPSYKLEVAGTAYISGALTVGGTITGTASGANVLKINNTMGLSDCLQYIQTSGQTSGNDLPRSAWFHVIKMNHGTGDTYYKRLMAFDFWGTNNVYTATAEGNGTVGAWKKFWLEGDSVTSAVWNDYAEYRESDCEEFGYVLCEKGDDTLTKTTERLQHFAGISSDTWGFSQGKTKTATTPIAVAGRVLAYTYKNRNYYKPGDCVCAAPGGTVDIMTREEIINYPDRIVGTVSCIPEYEIWGGGESADREPVAVNNRIWIKVK